MLRIYLYLILAASVSALATDMIVPALPLLQKAFHSDYSSIQLTISGFLVIYACSQLLSGFIGEKLGKLRVLTASFLLFLAGSLLCFMADSLSMLLAGRALQAVGAGAGPVLSKAIAKETFSPLTLKRALSDISSASAVVPLIAPLAGAAILGHLSWNHIFLVMALFSVVTLLLSPRRLGHRDSAAAPSSSGFITPAFIQGNAAGFADPEFAVLLYLAVAGHFYAAAWAEHNALLAAVFRFRVVFYYWQSVLKI